MRSKFDEQLKNLNEEMIQMGILIEENIQKAIEALVKSDVELAKVIMEKDAIIDRKQREIENICFQLLIQQQPVAKDLRAITAAMKMVTDMERIGDHAADISEITIMLSDSTRNENYDTIIKMASEASVMLIQSIDAFTEKNENKAKAVIDHDDVVDELFDRVKAELIELIRMTRDHDLPAIFTEANGADSAARIISAETGAEIFILDMAMAGDSYFDAMYHNIDTLKEALE